MPDIAALHPQVVHFVVALGIVGVLFRIVSLTGKAAWTSPSATALLILAAGASFVATESGEQAHGIPERIPGAREVVHEHEEAGEMARNLFVLIALIEVAGVALAKSDKAKFLRMGSAAVGLAACFYLYEAGEHGGELVYSYAGGVGTRSGNPEDVTRLLVAGLYQQARAKRQAGDSAEAARLIDELARQRPGDAAIQLLQAESALRDRKDPATALTLLAAITPSDRDRFAKIRVGLLRVDAYLAAGFRDSAQATLAPLAQEFPDAPWLKEAQAKLQ